MMTIRNAKSSRFPVKLGELETDSHAPGQLSLLKTGGKISCTGTLAEDSQTIKNSTVQTVKDI